MTILIGVVADDFTGASDIANTLARSGLATVQFLGLPETRPPAECEAAVVALKSRSIPASDAIELSLAALDWLRAAGARQHVFKYCSTFDSTPAGNIGPVGEALAKALGVRGVVACPAFPTNGRTVYQGHLFVGGKLLNESGMENHPLNPMTDADLRRVLAAQSAEPVGHVPWAVVDKGGGAIRAALAAAAEAGQRLVIVDAIADRDLLAIGEAVAGEPLITGGSGIALGLAKPFIARGEARGGQSAFRPSPGPGAILAGSCSTATLRQIEVHRASHPAFRIAAEEVFEARITPARVAAFIRQHADASPLAFSSVPGAELEALQKRFGREQLAARLEAFFAETARALVGDGVTRLVVAGGETSGAVVSGLGIAALAVGPEIDPGVPALSTAHGPPLALALKSGNFGAPDFFARALRMLGGGP
jgi:uncharacterized protein YgbK (DUF1537 family)